MAGLSLEVAVAVSIWFEVLLYGVYCCLFFGTLYIMIKKKKTATRPARIFFTVTIIMFILSSLHISINLYRLLQGFILLQDDITPNDYFLDLARWDNLAQSLVSALTIWSADSLAIYRCFLVWDSNFFVVIVPVLLVAMSIVANVVVLRLFTQVRSGTIFGLGMDRWIVVIYAITFLQNSITTSLIAYRIWKQDHRSVALGVSPDNGHSSLIPIVRIVIESAAIYLFQLLILNILYSLKHNAQYIFQEAMVPSAGIVFTLMTVRLAMRTRKTLMTTREGTTMPRFPLQWTSAKETDSTDVTTTGGPGENKGLNVASTSSIQLSPMPA